YGGTAVTSFPPSSIRPESGRSKPAMSRSSEVLPDPEGPSRVMNSPWAIVRLTLSTASTRPQRLETPSTRRAAGRTSSLGACGVASAALSLTGLQPVRCACARTIDRREGHLLREANSRCFRPLAGPYLYKGWDGDTPGARRQGP